ncbi:hypothetical protein [Sphingobacterium sp.]|uniref:hypothetical protein n=1 Tax=Sphingobacterium sp. TaxID=341027 RepID=UPI0028A1E9A5|nr:hypothetical protein [Sphingobacterium sp.]
MWEKNDYGGWSTNDPKDIAEFLLQNQVKDKGEDPPKKRNQENKATEKKDDKKKEAENTLLKEKVGKDKAKSTAFTLIMCLLKNLKISFLQNTPKEQDQVP